MVKRWCAIGAVAYLMALGAPVLGQPEDVARADALFTEGKRLLDEGEIDRACEMLAESQRLDPGGGTLLALALCHEKQGRLALAYSEYGAAFDLARETGNANREAVASSRRAALEPQLARLTIRVGATVAALTGLEVRAGSDVIAPSNFGVALPIDPGERQVVARAPGKRPFVTTARAAAGDSVVVDIATMEDETPPPAVRAPSPVRAPSLGHAARAPKRLPAADAPEPQTNDALFTAGWVVGGAGVIVLAVGTGFAIDAINSDAEADSRCADDVPCYDEEAIALSESAKRSADVATGVLVAGAAVTAGGIVMILLGKLLPNDSLRARTPFTIRF
jgi:hypothetical protein